MGMGYPIWGFVNLFWAKSMTTRELGEVGGGWRNRKGNAGSFENPTTAFEIQNFKLVGGHR